MIEYHKAHEDGADTIEIMESGADACVGVEDVTVQTNNEKDYQKTLREESKAARSDLITIDAVSDIDRTVFIIGAEGVGKSSLAAQILGDSNVAFAKDIHWLNHSQDGNNYHLLLAQIACSHQQAEAVMKVGHVFILVYDIQNPSTFQDIETFYKKMEMFWGKEKRPMVVIAANKVDLDYPEDNNHFLALHEMRATFDWGLEFFKLSARDNVGISSCFSKVIRQIPHELVLLINEEESGFDTLTKRASLCPSYVFATGRCRSYSSSKKRLLHVTDNAFAANSKIISDHFDAIEDCRNDNRKPLPCIISTCRKTLGALKSAVAGSGRKLSCQFKNFSNRQEGKYAMGHCTEHEKQRVNARVKPADSGVVKIVHVAGKRKLAFKIF